MKKQKQREAPTGTIGMAMALDKVDDFLKKQMLKLKIRNAKAVKSWNKKSNSNIHTTKMTSKQVETMFKGSGQL